MADRWFLKIDGVDGESTDAAHPGSIDVLAWSWGMAESGTGSGVGSGAGAGKASFEDFHFVTKISKASPKLILASAAGTHLKWAALDGVRASGKNKGAEYLKYKLTDVLVTNVDHEASDSDAPIEQFSLAYSKFQIWYAAPTSSGKVGTPTTIGWDVKANKKF